MEEDGVIKEIEHDDNCIWSYVGSAIGGLIGTIPWIMIYYFYSYNLPLLTALIPIMAVSGYKFFKGVVNSKTIRTIAIISIIIFILALVLLFPYFISKKAGIELKKIKKTEYYESYVENILNNISIELFSLIVGYGIAYAGIRKLLNRYKATNNMIKDMNTFIRKDNNPIDVEGYTNGGIRFTDKNESPISLNNKDNYENHSSRKQTTSNNVWDEKIKQSNYSRNSKNRINSQENTKWVIIFFMIFFGFPIISSIFFGIIAFIFNGINNSSSNTSNMYNYKDLNDIGNYEYEKYNDIENANYIFEKLNIELTIPDNWKIITEYEDGYLYLEDKYGYKKVFAIFESEEKIEDLQELHEEIIKSNTNSNDEIISIYSPINGNNAYYSIIELDNGYHTILYTMKYEKYFIVLIDQETNYYDFLEYNQVLKSISKAN